MEWWEELEIEVKEFRKRMKAVAKLGFWKFDDDFLVYIYNLDPIEGMGVSNGDFSGLWDLTKAEYVEDQEGLEQQYMEIVKWLGKKEWKQKQLNMV